MSSPRRELTVVVEVRARRRVVMVTRWRSRHRQIALVWRAAVALGNSRHDRVDATADMGRGAFLPTNWQQGSRRTRTATDRPEWPRENRSAESAHAQSDSAAIRASTPNTANGIEADDLPGGGLSQSDRCSPTAWTTGSISAVQAMVILWSAQTPQH